MPIERWTTAQVLALAPDSSSARSGQGLSAAAKWSAAGLSDELIWGLCRGSGKNPYQTCVDPREPAYKCSCPSRKFPCKHALGLLLLWAADGLTDQAAPDWVGQWRENRAARAQRAATQRAEGAVADPVAAGKRAAQRANRVAAGMAELDRWLLDQISQGLASTENDGQRDYETMAARLVDAQAPGAAGTVRHLGRLLGVGPHWTNRLLGELAQLRLLIIGYGRLDKLPPELAATVRSRVGTPVTSQEVLTGPALRDRWHVLGQVDLKEDRLISRRTWLQGVDSGRFALVLSYAAPGQALPADLPPGQVLDAEVCFYPGANPLRAVVAQRHGLSDPTGPPAAAESIRAALARWTAAVAADPWCDSVPVLLAKVTPSEDGHLIDAAGDALPLRIGHEQPWWLLAAAGGMPVTVAGEYGPDGLRPLAAWPQGRYVRARTVGNGVPVSHPLPADILAAALVGTARRPYLTGDCRVDGRPLRLAAPVAGTGTEVEAGAAVADDDPDGAAALLMAAAVAHTYQRAGIMPVGGRQPVEPAPAETVPEVPVATAHRLDRLIRGALPISGEAVPIVLEQFLAAVAQHGYRVPASMLPDLLDLGRRRGSLWSALAASSGRRGYWLAAGRDDWRYLLAEQAAEPDPAHWATGTLGQRLTYLVALRSTDPAAGLALLTESFAAEAPEDRARLLGALETGLCPADEPLLEQALDDRRAAVRGVAADLLDQLPSSALRQRMAERALAHVQLDRSLLGGKRLVVIPPDPDGDRTLRRDGLGGRPPGGVGPAAWLLEQILARTPLATWTEGFGLAPAKLLALPVLDDWAPLLHRGMARAAAAQQNPTWCGALVEWLVDESHQAWKLLDEQVLSQLVQAVPAADFGRYVKQALHHEPNHAQRLILLHPGPWTGELADAVLATIDALARREKNNWNIRELCRMAAVALPADRAARVAELAADLAKHVDDRRASIVERLAVALTFRHQMIEELS